MPLVHHELCFGCGRANLFGLLAELEPASARELTGRCFIKQDHQGDQPGVAHHGVLAAALTEAMALAVGQTPQLEPADHQPVRLRTLEVAYEATAPVGTFLEITATVDAGDRAAHAAAHAEGRLVATARGTFV